MFPLQDRTRVPSYTRFPASNRGLGSICVGSCRALVVYQRVQVFRDLGTLHVVAEQLIFGIDFTLLELIVLNGLM